MRLSTISPQDFLAGNIFQDHRPRLAKHNLKARWENGIKVTDSSGEPVKVKFAGTSDNRTVYAYVDGMGIIGGWHYPHRAMPFKALVGKINEGILYQDLYDLPNDRKKRVRLRKEMEG